MDNLQPGQMLGPYRIISQIGQGGMASVFKAYQPALDRYVAVKVLPAQHALTPGFSFVTCPASGHLSWRSTAGSWRCARAWLRRR